MNNNLLLFRFFVELKRSKLRIQFFCFHNKFFRQPKKVLFPCMFSWWAIFFPKFVDSNTQLDLSALSLDVGKCGSQQSQCFLLCQAQPMIRDSSSFSTHIETLPFRKERVYKINCDFIGHRQFKANHIRRSFSPRPHIALDPNMAFSIDHCSQVSKLPFF